VAKVLRNFLESRELQSYIRCLHWKKKTEINASFISFTCGNESITADVGTHFGTDLRYLGPGEE